MDLKALLSFRIFIIIIFSIMGGIILPIRRNEAQGSMGKKVFWLSVGVVLMLAVSVVLLKDQMYIRPYSGSWGYYFIFISALAVSYFFGYTIVLSDKFIVARSQLYIVFYGIILVGTILSFLFSLELRSSLYIGMGIYTLVLGAAEVGILWHRKKRLSERELNNADLPHTRGVSCWIARLCANSWRYKSFMYKDVARTQFIGSALGLPFEMMEKN